MCLILSYIDSYPQNTLTTHKCPPKKNHTEYLTTKNTNNIYVYIYIYCQLYFFLDIYNVWSVIHQH